MGTRISRSCSNCVLVVGLKRGNDEMLTVLVGSAGSTTTAAPAVVPLRAMLVFRSSNASSTSRMPTSIFWRCRRSCRSSGVSSSLVSSSSAARRRARSAWCSSIRFVLDFLLAAAAASSFALASAAFLAFSRSASESSAASQDSRTYRGLGRLVSNGFIIEPRVI